MSQICTLMILAMAADDDRRVENLDRTVLAIAANAREIEAGEPLFLKVTVNNGRSEPIWFKTKFASITGLLRFDLRPVDGEWKETISEDQGAVDYVNSRFTVAAKSTYCTFSTIFTVGGRFIFASQGKYELRARVKDHREELVSEPIELTVHVARDDQLKFLSSHKAVLGYLMPETGPSLLDDIKPISFDGVPEGRIRSYLEAHRLSTEWMRTMPGTPAAGIAERRLIEFVQKLDPVMKDEYLIAFALSYVKQQRFEDALAILDRLPDPSETTVSLRKEIAKKAPGLIQRK